MRVRNLVLAGAAVLSPIAVPEQAHAHSGGLDSSGGHYCRQAGYDSGKCAPLNSYHCHQSPCGETAATTTTKVTTTVARPTTTLPPTTTTTTAAVTTTTTTTAPTTTSTEATTTTTTAAVAVLPDAQPAAVEKDEASPAEAFVGLVLLGGMAYGGFRLLRRARRRSADAD